MPNFSLSAMGSVAGAASLKKGSAAEEIFTISSVEKSKCSKPSDLENSEMLKSKEARLRYSNLRR